MATVRTNHCTNPSFEVSATTGWALSKTVAGTPSFTRVSGGQVGDYALEATYEAQAAESNVNFGYQTPNPTVDNTTQNDYWTVSAYLKLGASTAGTYTVYLGLYELDGGGGWLANGLSSDLFASLTTSWQRFNYTRQATNASVARSTARLYVSQIHEGDYVDVLMDGVLLEKTDTLADYFDGDTTDTELVTYAWTGTEHASTSTATDVPSFTGIRVTRHIGA